MALARVSGQTPQAAGGTGITSIQVTLPQNVVAGNAIMAVGKHRNSGTVTFSDGLGNTWGNDVTSPVQTTDLVTIGSAKNIATGGSCTITFSTTASANRMGLSAMEYSGFSGGAALDKTASSNAASGTSVDTTATATTTAADELLIGGCTDGLGTTYTWTNSFTLVAENTATGRQSMADRIVAATGAYNATATLGSSTSWTAAIATYKAVGGGSPSPAPSLGLLGVGQ